MAIQTADIEKLLDKKGAPLLLLHDDDEETKRISKLLIKQGYVILHASTGEEAQSLLRQNNVSVLIAFHRVNGPSGLYLLSQAKEIRPSTRRILVSNVIVPEHLVKQLTPVTLIDIENQEKLLTAMENAFESFQLHRENELMQSILDKHHQELNKAEKREADHQLLSSKIQKALLIDPPPQDLQGLSISINSSASEAVDGDFIAFFRPAPHVLDLAIGDVMGKGLPSTLIATTVKNEFSKLADPRNLKAFHYDHLEYWAEDLEDPRQILKNIHLSLFQRLVDLEFYVSLIYGRFNLRLRTFTFIDCGFTKPLYFRKASGKANFISAPNFPVGTVPFPEYNSFEIEYEKGDFFLLYSDGITESQSPSGDLFGEEKLANLIEENAKLEPNALTELIRNEVNLFTQQKTFEDDLTFIIVKIENFLPTNLTKARGARFSSSLAQLGAVRDWVNEMAKKAPGDQHRLATELQLALDEIFTNIVLHGYNNKPGSPICIQAEYGPDFLEIEVLDQARSFNPEELPPLNLSGDLEHGYGWYLIQKITDEVFYIPKITKNGWNRLKIKKRYPNRGKSMELSHYVQEGALIVRLDFESLDAKRVPEFKEKVLQILNDQDAETVVFDLQKLQFIDSSGLGAFLSLMRQLNTRGVHLALACMSKPVKTIFELVSMQKIFDCYDSLDLAVRGKVKKS